jgi:nucleoside-diphosphate-sugar epimerase
MARDIKRILITGSLGQIGSELTAELRKRYGGENVVATDLRHEPRGALAEGGPFETLDVVSRDALDAAIKRHRIDTIVHLAAILSASGERKPLTAWEVNINGTLNVLEAARANGCARVFIPSSIGVFGPETPRDRTPQLTIIRPHTIYGITKVTGELLGRYYYERYGLDVRGLRYPGLISSEAPPGGGTTDYAVEMYYAAVNSGHYTCFVREDTTLPMMYMPDALRAAMTLLEVDSGRLTARCDYNVAAMSFSAGEQAAAIAKYVPGFACDFKPDFRQKIADTWPRSIDDQSARDEWGWKPRYDLETMTRDMLEKLRGRSNPS